MKWTKSWRRVLCLLFAAVLCFTCLNIPALAYSRIDVQKETSLSVHFGDGDNGFSQVPFRLYQVAEVSETVEFTWTESFAKYEVSLTDLDSQGWRALAQTLQGYVAVDDIQPLRTEETDEDGNAVFSPLQTGLYLVLGESFHWNGNTYLPEPFLITLPYLDQATDSWQYDPVSVCKYEVVPDPVETVNRKVMKVWEDEGAENQRPTQITVQLLENGQVYDTVTLSAENNWQHQWTDLKAAAQWSIVELEVPEDYTVSVSQEGTTFLVTNTYQSDVPVTPPDTNLPQTGMLWWPVPLLACAGVILFIIGWMRGHRKEEHEG